MSDAKATGALHFSLDGERLEGAEGDTLAAAMLRAGATTFTRSIKYHRPRGPFCLNGSCGQCLVRVDGVPSVPACRVPLREGMACERQNAPLGTPESDLMRAADFLFKGGLDHHHILVQSRLLGKVFLEVARRLSGLGELPEGKQGARPAEVREADLVVVGAGPAGVWAARAAVESGAADVVLVERDPRVGGAARLGLPGVEALGPLEEAASSLPPQGALRVNAELVALYGDEDAARPGRLLVREAGRLLLLKARRVVLACGGVSQPLPFPGNDRPGVYAARGLLALQERCGVRVGDRLALVGEGEELVRCARALQQAGHALAVILDVGAPPVRAEGLEIVGGEAVRVRGDPARELQLRTAAGELRKVRCDAVALALPQAPLHEPASALGARTRWSAAAGGFPLEVDADGRTSVPWILAAGSVAERGGARARASGEAAGRAAAKDLAGGAR